MLYDTALSRIRILLDMWHRFHIWYAAENQSSRTIDVVQASEIEDCASTLRLWMSQSCGFYSLGWQGLNFCALQNQTIASLETAKGQQVGKKSLARPRCRLSARVMRSLRNAANCSISNTLIAESPSCLLWYGMSPIASRKSRSMIHNFKNRNRNLSEKRNLRLLVKRKLTAVIELVEIDRRVLKNVR